MEGWKHPKAPRIALLNDERATKAVLSFLRKMKVGQMVTIPRRGGEKEEGGGGGEPGVREEVEGEEGDRIPPQNIEHGGARSEAGAGGSGGLCVCNLLIAIPLYATQAGHDSGSAEGSGVFVDRFPGARPAWPVVVGPPTAERRWERREGEGGKKCHTRCKV